MMLGDVFLCILENWIDLAKNWQIEGGSGKIILREITTVAPLSNIGKVCKKV